ncbi:glycosyltransferase family 4 protein [Streptomyces pactum]|uniref:glycosyltransferase family 4 protein n=1 Tax=Streptomyces pactum TaxID=68249 RepID=UPI0036F60EE3
MRISFLLHNAYGIGGTIRCTFNVAGALAAAGHDVEIVTLVRSGDTPSLPLHPQVRIVPLIELRRRVPGSDARNPLRSRPSRYVPEAEAGGTKNFNALTDERLAEYLAATDADAVIATRPGLVIALAESGSDRYLRIGQEHRLYTTHSAEIRAACDAAIGRLDAFTSVSEADAATHRAALPHVSTLLTAIPNAVPPTPIEPSDGRAKLVVAAGRLIPVKRYDLLVGAWAQVAARHPDWRLRIYGRGPQQPVLREKIDELGLADHITMMGAHSPIETEWAKGSIAAVTSREESFGMTIVEAMHCGVPVVATDCPHGPGEIITDGKDGLLVPVGDVDGIAAGLCRLIEDEELRRSMGEAARVSARRYSPEEIAARYEALFAELRERRAAAPAPAAAPARRRGRAADGRTPELSLKARLRARVVQLIRRPLRPVASCRVDPDGNLRVLVEADGLHGDELNLTITRRRHPEDRVTLPLRPPAGTGRSDRPEDAPPAWTAVLDRTRHTLAEGRWDLHVVRPSDGARRRVVCRYAEGRGLLLQRPLPGSPVHWWAPYPTVDGFLALRAWHRTAHAEATALRAEEEELTVEGTLYGFPATGGTPEVLAAGALTAVAVPRPARGKNAGAPPEPVTVPVIALGGDRFRFTVPYAPLHGAAVWDLTVRDVRRPAPEGPDPDPIRVGRFIGDIVDRNQTDLMPVLGGFRPYFTKASNLAISREARPS